jgi:hypothetical protein
LRRTPRIADDPNNSARDRRGAEDHETSKEHLDRPPEVKPSRKQHQADRCNGNHRNDRLSAFSPDELEGLKLPLLL